MRHVVLVVIILFGLQFFASASTTVTPTTTLAIETGNNTSAANTFQSQTNGNLAASNVSKMPLRSLLYNGTTTKTYVHFMGWFGGNNHMNIGYSSNDAAQVARQVHDMMSRGIDGAIFDWYGQNNVRSEQTAQLLRAESEKQNGQFTFAITEDVGALNTCSATPGCDLTTQVITDLTYAYKQYENSPAYIRVNGRPAVFFFGMDSQPLDWVRIRANAPGNPLFIFRNSSAFSKAITDGGYNWVGISTTDPNNMGLNNMDGFYMAALRYPNLIPYGSAYKGFDDSLARWGSNRKVNQQCGQTWLATLAEAGKYYSATRQLANMQIATWNDYEEATEIESGIDNCVTVSGAMAGSALNWGITGQENTLDHYTIFISTDGQNLMPVADVAAGTHTLDLSQFSFAPAQYTIYVKAVGKSSIRNHMSAAISYSIANLPPVAKLTVSPNSGIGSVTASATTAGSYDTDGKIVATRIDFGDGTAVLGATATHTYTTPGSYTVTATVTDDNGSSTNATAAVNVAANQPPLARLTVTPATGIAPVTVSASTAASSDSDGSIVSSAIDFGDHTIVIGASASHVYSVPGTYTVTGLVTDNLGATSSATATVTIAANQPPLARLTVTPATGIAPVTVSASTAASSDSDGSIVSSAIDFGDHTVVVGASASHVYSVPGTYTVTGTVKDNLGATSSSTATVTIAANQPPLARLSVTPTTGIAPVTVSASTAASSDSDGSIVSSAIDFGDHTVVVGASASHVYSVPGTYTVTGTVKDNLGATSSATATVIVAANQPPLARLSVTPTTGTAPVTVSASTAASSDSDGSIVSSTIDFGDHTVVVGASASHVYSVPGTYTVTGTVKDNLGATSSATATVTVTAPANKPPVASLSLNTTVAIAPATVTASTSGSSDPDGSIASSAINWGDGTTSAGPAASHVYNKAGVYSVIATVIDNKGATATASSTVTVSYGVNIVTPVNGATTTASTHVVATASSSGTITAMRIYVDYVSVYLVNKTTKLDTYISLTKGIHRVVLQSWDSAGVVNKATVFVTVP